MKFINASNMVSAEKRKCLSEYLDKCISDQRLLHSPIEKDIELKNSKVVFSYTNGDDYLTINIKCGGMTYYDNCLDYFYKSGDIIQGKINTNWNEVLGVINKWHSHNKTA